MQHTAARFGWSLQEIAKEKAGFVSPFKIRTCAAPTGTRTNSENLSKTTLSEQGGTESGTGDAIFDPLPPGLVRLIESWEQLPEAVKADIMEIINATVPEEG